jgi:hypothetical protein
LLVRRNPLGCGFFAHAGAFARNGYGTWFVLRHSSLSKKLTIMPYNPKVTSWASSVKACNFNAMNDLGKQVLTKKGVVVSIPPHFSFCELEIL